MRHRSPCLAAAANARQFLLPRFRICAANQKDLCLQVRADDRLEIARKAKGDNRQKWKVIEDHLQNVGTGLFLDTEVKYVYMKDPGKPWETCGTALFVRPKSNDDRQRWFLDGRGFIRHVKDGRCVDVNGWKLNHGQEVNCNIAHTSAHGITWDFGGVPMPLLPTRPGRSTEERRGCYIKLGTNRSLCLEVDPATRKTRLGKCSDSPHQRWNYFEERLQNVGTGTFLHAPQQYIFVQELGKPWEGNHSWATVEAKSDGDEQRWFFDGSMG